jgi:nonsense-mediated mRNA decay protein 3
MILPNAANQCPACLAANFDLKAMVQGNTEGDPIIVHQCRQCRRYARSIQGSHIHYEYCEPESPQLLSICLKHIPILTKKGHSSFTHNKIQIMDSSWIWTEPNSMRLKLRVTVRADVEDVTLQQRVPVLFKIHWKMCNNCDREYTNRTWHAVVQLRQRRESGAPKKGLAVLEMALSSRANRDLRNTVLKIDASRHGLDFYFLSLSKAQHFAQFLSRLAPIKIKTSSKLISADVKCNTANMQYTLTCEVVPLCRDDLVLVHKESRSLLGGRLALVTKVASVVHLTDASPKRSSSNKIDHVEITAEAYHKNGGGGGSAKDNGCYTILQTSERLVRFVVLDVELCAGDDNNNNNNNNKNGGDGNNLYEGPSSGVKKYALADVQVARESDLGANDEVLNCITHLGHLIKPGDIVLGYDLVSSSGSLNTTVHKASSTKKGSSFMGASSVVGLRELLNSNVILQDVVLVKKISGKEQRQKELAEDAATRNDGDHHLKNDDDNGGDGDSENRTGSAGKFASKKKLRRQRKRDKKLRELAESAERMGFMDDLAEAQAPYYDDNDDDDDDEEVVEDINNDENILLSKRIENDPELEEELRAVERELAAAYPDDDDDNDDDKDEGEEVDGNEQGLDESSTKEQEDDDAEKGPIDVSGNN